MKDAATRMNVRGRAAVAAGHLAGRASRLLGRGSGGMIGGTVALTLDPRVLTKLALIPTSVLVTGTNGKSTTTRMVRAALGTQGAVASNTNGDNMTPGITTALMNDARASFAALEVDEMHMPTVARQVRPAVMVLLNLSRDQLDRVGEIGTVESRLRKAVDENPSAHIVANCDDPLIVSAAWGAKNVTWVAAGSGWGADSASFPRGGGRVLRGGDDWWIEGNDKYRRPQPDWWMEGQELVGRDGTRLPLRLRIPGRVNLLNAAVAIAAASVLGIEPQVAGRAIADVRDVAGRYQVYDVAGRAAHLLLAKNPAGWQEALAMLDRDVPQAVVAVNGQIPDGEDLSWLWDVNFEALQGRDFSHLFAAGQRATDLQVRLDYAGITASYLPDPLQAILQCEPGPVEVLANYTALRDLLIALKAAGYRPEVNHE